MSDRVLVVEDSEVASTTLVSILGRAGFETRVATTVVAAREAVATWEPTCVLLDRRLPDGDGVTLAGELRNGESAAVGVVLLSGDPIGAGDVDADVVLLKPAGAREVLDAVRTAVRRSRSHRGSPGHRGSP